MQASKQLAERTFGYAVVSDPLAVATALAPEIAGHQGATQPVVSQGKGSGDPVHMLLVGLGVPAPVTAALDTRRPMGGILLDPSTSPSGVPLAFAFPVTSQKAALAGFAASFPKVPGTASDPNVFQYRSARFYVRFAEKDEGKPNLALVTFEPGIAGAVHAYLAPQLAAPRGVLVVRAALDRIYQKHGPAMEAALAQLAILTGAGAGDSSSGLGMRRLRRLVTFVDDATSLELQATFPRGGIAVTVRLEGKPGGPFSQLVSAQTPGPAWGSELVPRDAMLVYTTHTALQGRRADAEDLVAYATGLHGAPDQKRTETWRTSAIAFADTMLGEAFYAVWPAPGGGVGLGGGFRVGTTGQAQARLTHAYATLAPALGSVVAHQLGMDPERFRFKASVRRAAERIGATPIDLVEVRPRWPKNAAAERKTFRWLFGDKLVLATASSGDRVLYAAGRDWRARMQGMLAAASGSAAPEASIVADAGYAGALRMREQGRVSLAYVSTTALAAFVKQVMADQNSMGPVQEKMLAPFLTSSPADAALVVSTNVSQGDRGAAYEVTLRLPAPVFGAIGGVGGAMWRVAIAPIIGPPAIPPLPTPPPSVTPPPDEPTNEKEKKESPHELPNGPSQPGELPTGRGA